jgi:hypothetical protein
MDCSINKIREDGRKGKELDYNITTQARNGMAKTETSI